MKHARRLLVLALLPALVSCAGARVLEGSTLPPMPAPPPEPGLPAPVLSPEEADAAMRGLAAALRGGGLRLASESPLQVALDAEESFDVDSAQLRLEALERCAALAQALLSQPATVTHVVVTAPPEADTEPSQRLAARRAASLAQHLERQGLPATRLRAEGRAGAAEVRLTVRPVVAGREAEAWVPPP